MIKLRAHIYKTYKKFYNTFAGDPLVTINYTDAEKLFTEMVARTTDYLPDYIKEWARK